MRILFIVEHFPCLSETFVLNQVTGLIDRGHDVEVYPVGKPVAPVVHPDFTKYDLQARTWAGPNNPPTRLRRVGRAAAQLPRCLRRFPLSTIESVNVLRYGRAAANLYLFYSLLPFLDNRREFDIIHCHFGDKGVLAQLWKHWGVVRGKLSVVFHAHEMAGLSEAEGRELYGALFKSDALLLPVTNYWRDRLLRWGARSERTLVHRMGVDCDRFQFQPKPIVLDAQIQLLSVCRLTEMKGVEYGIRAVAKLRPQYPGLRYTIAGGGPLRDHLEGLIRQLGVRDIVTMAGPQPQDKVAGLLRGAHIYLVPSVTDSIGCQEGLPVALMEALASGVPAIGTRHAGIPELISDRITGLLVEERDVDGLASAIESLVIDPQTRLKVARQGRAVVEREFNIGLLNERLENLFRSELAA
jgi:colanic acid/amylovoran biosynthesis glycosyltransferase